MQRKLNTKYAEVYNSKRFKFMVGGKSSLPMSISKLNRANGGITALTLATTTILIRTIYRVLYGSYAYGPVTRKYPSSLPRDNTFMVLEGAMMAIACLALTVGHPGLGLASVWKEGNVRAVKGKSDAVVVGEEGVSKEEGSSFESEREQVVMSGAK